MIKSLSIIIPAFNEEKTLKKTVFDIQQYLSKTRIQYEIIIIDDGSIDSTYSVSKKLENKDIKIFKNIKNKGKGFSIKKGIRKAKKDYILFMDADNATRIIELDNFEKLIKKYQIIFGSRALKNSKIIIHQPKLRETYGKFYNFIIRILFNIKIKDTQCGFKFFERKTAEKIFEKITSDRWCFDTEIFVIAKKNKIKYKEMPITWKNNKNSKIKFFRDIFVIPLELIKIKFNQMMGKYRI